MGVESTDRACSEILDSLPQRDSNLTYWGIPRSIPEAQALGLMLKHMALTRGCASWSNTLKAGHQLETRASVVTEVNSTKWGGKLNRMWLSGIFPVILGSKVREQRNRK
jgi:hypothetical protein